MHYVRLYADDAGETPFEDVEITLQPSDLAPPTPPVDLSAFIWTYVEWPSSR